MLTPRSCDQPTAGSSRSPRPLFRTIVVVTMRRSCSSTARADGVVMRHSARWPLLLLLAPVFGLLHALALLAACGPAREEGLGQHADNETWLVVHPSHPITLHSIDPFAQKAKSRRMRGEEGALRTKGEISENEGKSRRTRGEERGGGGLLHSNEDEKARARKGAEQSKVLHTLCGEAAVRVEQLLSRWEDECAVAVTACQADVLEVLNPCTINQQPHPRAFLNTTSIAPDNRVHRSRKPSLK